MCFCNRRRQAASYRLRRSERCEGRSRPLTSAGHAPLALSPALLSTTLPSLRRRPRCPCRRLTGALSQWELPGEGVAARRKISRSTAHPPSPPGAALKRMGREELEVRYWRGEGGGGRECRRRRKRCPNGQEICLITVRERSSQWEGSFCVAARLGQLGGDDTEPAAAGGLKELAKDKSSFDASKCVKALRAHRSYEPVIVANRLHVATAPLEMTTLGIKPPPNPRLPGAYGRGGYQMLPPLPLGVPTSGLPAAWLEEEV